MKYFIRLKKNKLYRTMDGGWAEDMHNKKNIYFKKYDLRRFILYTKIFLFESKDIEFSILMDDIKFTVDANIGGGTK